MKRRKSYFLYKLIKNAVRFFYPRTEIVGSENLPDEAAIIVANHAQMNGPIVCELYFPRERYTWCAGEMMHLSEVPRYAYEDFWSGKSKLLRPFYKLLSYVIAPLSVCVFNNANTVGVYHDKRIISTLKNSVRHIREGTDIVIFPEHNVKYNNIVYDFQKGFTELARLYYKRYGIALCFVPMYIAPNLKSAYIGRPERYKPENEATKEQKRICLYLKDTITELAASLPRHKVVPYLNISRKEYPYNKESEADIK